MPTYDYACGANGRTIEVRHAMSERIDTWGELCTVSGQPLDGTPADAPVHKVFTASTVVDRANLGSGMAPACDSGPCCGGGMCGLN
jgi:predicted nucleic acid-binding Zn ribbon protein